MRRLTDEQRIEQFFINAKPEDAKLMLEKINLIMRTRGVAPPEPRRGRPRNPKPKEPPKE